MSFRDHQRHGRDDDRRDGAVVEAGGGLEMQPRRQDEEQRGDGGRVFRPSELPGQGIGGGAREEEELHPGHLDQEIVMQEHRPPDLIELEARRVQGAQVGSRLAGDGPGSDPLGDFRQVIVEGVADVGREEPDLQQQADGQYGRDHDDPALPGRTRDREQPAMRPAGEERGQRGGPGEPQGRGGQDAGRSGNQHDRRDQEEAQEQEEDKIGRRLSDGDEGMERAGPQDRRDIGDDHRENSQDHGPNPRALQVSGNWRQL